MMGVRTLFKVIPRIEGIERVESTAVQKQAEYPALVVMCLSSAFNELSTKQFACADRSARDILSVSFFFSIFVVVVSRGH